MRTLSPFLKRSSLARSRKSKFKSSEPLLGSGPLKIQGNVRIITKAKNSDLDRMHKTIEWGSLMTQRVLEFKPILPPCKCFIFFVLEFSKNKQKGVLIKPQNRIFVNKKQLDLLIGQRKNKERERYR